MGTVECVPESPVLLHSPQPVAYRYSKGTVECVPESPVLLHSPQPVAYGPACHANAVQPIYNGSSCALNL